jgi:short-subunit dehydrogenase
MVLLPAVQEWNAQLKDANTYPPEPVAVITGGTNGIGAATAKAFAASTTRPRIYILGRSQETANEVITECRRLNPKGEYIFKKVDLSLIKNVDAVSEEIKQKESKIHVLVLSAGGADTLGKGT